jgi:hypothetical protein
MMSPSWCFSCRLKKLDQIDEARKLREQAKNRLEAFIYSTRNKMTMDSEDVEASNRHHCRHFSINTSIIIRHLHHHPLLAAHMRKKTIVRCCFLPSRPMPPNACAVPLQKVSNEEQREQLSVALEDAEMWLYDEGEATTLEAYNAKYKDVKAVADVILVPLDLLQNPPPPPPPVVANDTLSVNGTDAADANSTATIDADGDTVNATASADASDDAAASSDASVRSISVHLWHLSPTTLCASVLWSYVPHGKR